MKDALATALNSIATFVPQLVLFVVILLIGVLVAKVLSKAVNKVLERVGFDRAIERGGIGKALQKSTYDPSDVLAKLVYYAVMLFTLQLAFSAFGPNPISDLLTAIIAFLPQVFVAIIIIVVASSRRRSPPPPRPSSKAAWARCPTARCSRTSPPCSSSASA